MLEAVDPLVDARRHRRARVDDDFLALAHDGAERAAALGEDGAQPRRLVVGAVLGGDCLLYTSPSPRDRG